MVALPDPSQFSVTKPVSTSLSGAEVASPYVEMAKSLDKGGEALNAYAIEEAKRAGEVAGQQARVDDNGNIIMDKAPFLVGPAAPEYRRAATMSAAMKMEPQIQNKALELRLAHPNDPERFKTAMSEYQSTLLDKIDDPHLKAGISNMVATSAAQNYRTSLVETNNNTNKEFLFNSTNKIKDLTDQIHSLDRQGAGYDPSGKRPPSKEYIDLVASRLQIANEVVGNKQLGISQERMDNTLKEMIDQGKVQAVIGDVQREFKDRGNIIAAKAALQDRLLGPEGNNLGLTIRQKEAAIAEGIKSLNYLDAADRQAIRDNGRAVTQHIEKVTKNPELHDPGEYQEMLDYAKSIGDKNSVYLLQTLPGRVDWNKYFRTLDDRGKAEALQYIARGQTPPGFHPSGGVEAHGGLAPSFVEAIKRSEGLALTATWDFKQPSYGYGARAPYVGARTTKEQAERDLDADLTKAAKVVDAVNPNLDSGTRAALVSLTHNAGSAWTTGVLGQKIRAGDIEGAKQPFLAYINAGGAPLQALQDRRAQEVAWFGAAEAQPGPPIAAGGAPIRGMLPPGNPATPRMVSAMLSDTIAMTKPMAKATYDSVTQKLRDGNPLGEGEAELAVSTNHIIGEDGKVEELLTKMKAARAAGLVKPGDYQSASDQVQIAMGSGLPRVQYEFMKETQANIERDQKERRENTPVYLSKTFSTPAPNPIHVSNPPAAIGEVAARSKSLEMGQGLDLALGPAAIFGKEEARDISGQIQTVDGGQAGAFLAGLRAAIPNDGNYLAAIDRLKDPIIALSRSPDYQKLAAGFSAMSLADATNPAAALHIFGEPNIDRMHQFKVLQSFMLPDELAEHFNKVAAVSEKDIKERRTAVAEDMKKVTADDVAYQISSAWPITPAFVSRLAGTQGYAPPTKDAVKESVNANAEFVRDYKDTLQAYVEAGLPLDNTTKQVVANKMKSKWSPSAIAGGVIMKNAPEMFYDKDKVMGSYDWAINDMSKFMTDRLGPEFQMIGEPSAEIAVTDRNWRFKALVSDAQTEREAQDPKRRPDGSVIKPSYRIAYTDAKGQIRFLDDRIAWDEGTLESAAEYGPQLESNAPKATAATGPLGEFQERQRKATARQQLLEERARSEFQAGP